MSTYTTVEKMQALLPKEVLRRLTDDQRQTEINTDIIESEIIKASNVIDAQLSGVYDTPFSSPYPDIIVSLTEALTTYFLWARVEREDVAEDKKEWVYDMLEKLRNGTILIPGMEMKDNNNLIYMDTDEQNFTDEELSKW